MTETISYVPTKELAAVCLAAGFEHPRSEYSAKLNLSEGEPDPRLSDLQLSNHQKAILVARNLLRLSKRRAQVFGLAHLDDPSWHILLDLFVSDHDGRKVSVSSACLASMSPQTTALRYLAKMAESGDIERSHDHIDNRRIYVAISGAAKDRMINLLVGFS
jgi:DNA-binding MarR family transcriptional regulator